MEHAIPKRNRDEGGDARVRRSRERLRAAFLTLLETRPPDEISIRDITAASGIGYTTYFRHYANKEALLDDLVAREVTELTRLAAATYDRETSGAACRALCAYVDDRRSLWSGLLNGGAAPLMRDALLREGRATMAAQFPARSLPADLSIAIAVAVIVELLSWWLRQPDPWPVDRVAVVLDRTIIAPLAALEG